MAEQKIAFGHDNPHAGRLMPASSAPSWVTKRKITPLKVIVYILIVVCLYQVWLNLPKDGMSRITVGSSSTRRSPTTTTNVRRAIEPTSEIYSLTTNWSSTFPSVKGIEVDSHLVNPNCIMECMLDGDPTKTFRVLPDNWSQDAVGATYSFIQYRICPNQKVNKVLVHDPPIYEGILQLCGHAIGAPCCFGK